MKLTQEQEKTIRSFFREIIENHREEINNANFSKYLLEIANCGAAVFLKVAIDDLKKVGVHIPSAFELVDKLL